MSKDTDKKYAEYFETENNKYYFQDSRVDGLIKQVSDITEILPGATSQITDIQSDITDINNKINEHTNDIVSANQNITKNTNDIDNLSNGVSNCNDAINDIRDDITAAESNFKIVMGKTTNFGLTLTPAIWSSGSYKYNGGTSIEIPSGYSVVNVICLFNETLPDTLSGFKSYKCTPYKISVYNNRRFIQCLINAEIYTKDFQNAPTANVELNNIMAYAILVKNDKYGGIVEN